MTLREIKRRLLGVKNTQKITRAMKIVAATKLKRWEKDALGGRPFFEHIENMIRDLAAAGVGVANPYLTERRVNKMLIMLVTSDRGLCGAFNSNLARKVFEFAKGERAKGKQVELYVIGAKGIRFFTAKGEGLFKSLQGLERRAKQELACELTRELVGLFTGGSFDEIVLAYNGFVNRSSYVGRIQSFLPITVFREEEAAAKEENKGFYAFEPTAEDVLGVLFPLYLESKIFRSLIESKTSEEAARMLAMDYATENASEITDELTLLYNRVRQSGITKEISEIVGGAEALR